MNGKLSEPITADNLIKAVFSKKRDDGARFDKLTVRFVSADGGGFFQSEGVENNRAYHENFDVKSAETRINALIDSYGQSNLFYTDRELAVLVNRKGERRIISRSTEKRQADGHNRQKRRLLEEGDDIPVLRELGIFTADGKLVSSMSDKYRQINRFAEILDEGYKADGDSVSILDFGCGKSYLTFVTYYLFKYKKGLNTRIIGYDLKEETVADCNRLAEKFGYDGLRFKVADVGKDKLADEKIDIVISLHACDTATDYALKYAIDKKVGLIFSVPCCQHEVNSSIKRGGEFDLLLQKGLIKERFSALLTDAIRCETLEAEGYETDVIEFVDFEHSPKNLMIRARKKDKEPNVSVRADKLNALGALSKKYKFRQKLLELTGAGNNNTDGGRN